MKKVYYSWRKFPNESRPKLIIKTRQLIDILISLTADCGCDSPMLISDKLQVFTQKKSPQRIT